MLSIFFARINNIIIFINNKFNIYLLVFNIKFIQEKNSGVAPIIKIKENLVFIGDPGVGKTSIIFRFMRGTFGVNVSSTVEVNLANKMIEICEIGKSLDLYNLDTVGQEKYK